MSSKALRNILILVAIAAAVAFLPGGGSSAGLVMAVLTIAIAVIFVLLGVRFYLENRVAIFALGDKHRALLYGAFAAAVLAMAGRSLLLDTAIGSIVFFALLLGAVGALYAVWQHHRAYGY